ncbi:DUF2200 domain-containing protein [Microbacterium sp.]|uniref:DUF2200 domain-containing protein n=1 Tax=Microbacterium sp. TaxID=51671 RepID=UPI003C773864
MDTSERAQQRIRALTFASVYPLYVQKVERKGRTTAELDEVIRWLTGLEDADLARHLTEGSTFVEIFDDATLNPNAHLITGVICGVRVEDITDPFMQKLRYLDKLVDELARGKALEKILRTPAAATTPAEPLRNDRAAMFRSVGT